MGSILVFVEHLEGRVKKVSLELLEKASELAQGLGVEAHAVAIGDLVQAEGLGGYGAKQVFVVRHDKLKTYNAVGFVTVLADLIREHKPDVFLGTSSPVGKDLFPRLSARLKTGFAQDCVDLKVDNGKILATRPVYAGKALIDVKIQALPQMFTVRPNSFPVKAPSTKKAQVVTLEKDPGTLLAVVKELVKGDVGKVDLSEAERIISGGRSLKSAENFKIIRDCAEVLGAAVGASRAAVDAGYAPHDMQVGQTGKVVNPLLYIACGISGAVQHLAGMRTSKVIVAINKDPEAPIFKKADYGIVGDLFEVVPLLTQELKKTLAE